MRDMQRFWSGLTVLAIGLSVFMGLFVPAQASFVGAGRDVQILQVEGETPKVCHSESYLVNTARQAGALALAERHTHEGGGVVLFLLLKDGSGALLLRDGDVDRYCRAYGMHPLKTAHFMIQVSMAEQNGTVKVVEIWKEED